VYLALSLSLSREASSPHTNPRSIIVLSSTVIIVPDCQDPNHQLTLPESLGRPSPQVHHSAIKAFEAQYHSHEHYEVTALAANVGQSMTWCSIHKPVHHLPVW
jgi:hypothetical protein